jgi:hypothetical protein
MSNLTVIGLDAALRELSPQRLQTAIGDVLMAVAASTQDLIAPYPPQSHRKQPFKTAKSRRWFFANLRAGTIQVPYVRGGLNSQTLGRRWHINRVSALQAVLVNDATYADLVHGAETQTAYMRDTGWKTDEGVAQEIQSSGVIERIAGQVLAQLYTG